MFYDATAPNVQGAGSLIAHLRHLHGGYDEGLRGHAQGPIQITPSGSHLPGNGFETRLFGVGPVIHVGAGVIGGAYPFVKLLRLFDIPCVVDPLDGNSILRL
ncbi:hypothetical protein D3C71_1691610 [compost metagenome]